MIIYKATNKLNGKNYIGQTTGNLNKRKNRHYRDSLKNIYLSKFHYALKKYDKKDFDWSILCECKTLEELNEKEKFFIKEFDSFGKNGYNLTNGGENYIRSEETKMKMSQQRKGRILSENWKKNLSIAGKNKKVSDETKKKMSDSLKGRECNWLKGKKLSDDTKKKMSLSQIGNKNGIGNKNKFGKLLSDETKKKISDNCKGINSKSINRFDLNGNYIDTWSSITEFEFSINKKSSHISAVCLGKRKSACGYIWKYNEK